MANFTYDPTVEAIDSFDGIYGFLSNMDLVPIFYEGYWYPSLEHAYQASKTTNLNHRLSVLNQSTPWQAREMGKAIDLRGDWDIIKVPMMLAFLRQKFANIELQVKLLQTGDAILIEGNQWKDTYWGICNGVGSNILGQLLMQVRDELSIKFTYQ